MQMTPVSTGSVNSLDSVLFGEKTRINYVVNLTPKFEAPKSHKSRPGFLEKAMNYARKRDITNWAGFRAQFRLNNRSRYFNIHRNRAMNALCVGILHYVNLVTWEIECPVFRLTELCGLDTTAESGRQSITRGSRAIEEFERYGLIRAKNTADKQEGNYLTKFMEVTDFFWDAIGMTAKKAIHEQELRFEMIRAGLPDELAKSITITEYKKMRELRSIQRNFEIRRKRTATRKEYSRARRIAALPKDEQRRKVASYIWTKLNDATATILQRSPSDFDVLVTKEIYRLNALATDPPEYYPDIPEAA